MQFIGALETFQDRFGSIDCLKGEHPEIARAVGMLPDDHPLRPATTAGALTTDKFVTTARQLTGQPAGPGIARGTARVIINHGDLFTFKAGEILVCDSIDPTMTFVIPLAAAVVERRGGMLIHGAIIAREYGLPCVTGIQDATLFIKTGDTVTVDGYLGIVTVG
ncbi:MAG: PEP-utilizing enzyme [Desulfomicrobium escambiense]|nr:PEP-utilizing enzyme [Desulfomicrobium escambiense]